MKIVSLKQINIITPQKALVIATVLALLTLGLSANMVQHQPWLGLDLLPAEDGLLIESVAKTGPSFGILHAGDILIGIADVQGNRAALQAEDIIEDPDELLSYEQYNGFMFRQGVLSEILNKEVIRLELNDGIVVQVQPGKTRDMLSLPWSFWVNHLFAFFALAISVGIWSVKREMLATRLLFLSGFALFLGAVFSSLYISRELALSSEFFHVVSEINSISNRVFCVCGLGLLWHYPRTLAPHLPVLIILMLLESIYVINEMLQWQQPPLHAFYFDFPLLAMVAVGFGIWHWRKSKSKPLERAIVKWFLMSIFLSSGLVLLVFVIPVFFSGQPLLSVSGSYMILLIMYIGLALGALRYRLFDIGRWWGEMWIWFFAGIAIIAFDMVLIWIGHVAPPFALGVSVIAVGWLYFPFRQWIWGKVFQHTRRSPEEYMPLLVSYLMRVDRADSASYWEKMLAGVFHPLDTYTRYESVEHAKVDENGMRLRVPGLVPDMSIELVYAEKGVRLFNREDVKLADALFNIARRMEGQREVYVRGMKEERQRIMRDLHDDVGGRLLTLTHAETGESKTAKEALKSLREIIYTLDTEQQMTLNAAIARWRLEVVERCQSANVSFEWCWEELEQDIELSPRHTLNLTLIFRELLSNAFQHAEADCIRFDIRVKNNELIAHISNDGVKDVMKQGKLGKGLHNISVRTEELGGSFDYSCEAAMFCVRLTIPLCEASDA